MLSAHGTHFPGSGLTLSRRRGGVPSGRGPRRGPRAHPHDQSRATASSQPRGWGRGGGAPHFCDRNGVLVPAAGRGPGHALHHLSLKKAASLKQGRRYYALAAGFPHNVRESRSTSHATCKSLPESAATGGCLMPVILCVFTQMSVSVWEPSRNGLVFGGSSGGFLLSFLGLP